MLRQRRFVAEKSGFEPAANLGGLAPAIFATRSATRALIGEPSASQGHARRRRVPLFGRFVSMLVW
jgi:hypothetical protein